MSIQKKYQAGVRSVRVAWPAHPDSCGFLWHILRLSRKPVARAGPRRDRQRCNKARMGVVEPEIAAMQRGDGRGQAEAKPGTRQGAARLQPDEPFNGMLAVGHRNPRAMIGNAQ